MRKHTDGFTLVELMVVVLVIGILVAVAVPVFRAAKNTAEKNTCQSFQRTWAGVVQQARANGDEPVVTTEAPKKLAADKSDWWTVATAYLKSVPKCPTSRSDYWVYQSAQGTSTNGDLVGCSGADSAKWASGHQFFTPSTGDVLVWEGLVYKVITAEGDREWLDRNLGATSNDPTDSASYGWLYQWGRGNDGHQLRTSGRAAGPTGSNTPGPTFFYNSTDPYRWYSGSEDESTFWTAAGGINNPCPNGFHVPTQDEWKQWRSAAGVTTSESARLSKLKLPAAGMRYELDGTIYYEGSRGEYWSSSTHNPYSHNYWFSSTEYNADQAPGRAEGASVRPIKNK